MDDLLKSLEFPTSVASNATADPSCPQITRAKSSDFAFDESPPPGASSALDALAPAEWVTIASFLMPLQILKVVHLLEAAKGTTRWAFRSLDGVAVISCRLDSLSSVVVVLRGKNMIEWQPHTGGHADEASCYVGDLKNCTALYKCLSLGTRLGNHRVEVKGHIRGGCVERFRFDCLDHSQESRGSTDVTTSTELSPTEPVDLQTNHAPERYSRFVWVWSKELVSALRSISFSPNFQLTLDQRGLRFSSQLRGSFGCEAPVKFCTSDPDLVPFTQEYECRSLGSLIRLARTQTKVVVGLPIDATHTAIYFGIYIGPCVEPYALFTRNSGHPLQESHAHFYIRPCSNIHREDGKTCSPMRN